MKSLFTLTLILSFNLLFGQQTYPTKEDVYKVIKLTISQKITKNNSSCEYGQCGEWWTANNDSLFYKKDTLKFYNSSNIVYGDTTFCNSLVWDFSNNETFSDSKAQMCQEPPTRTIKGGFFPGHEKIKMPNKYEVSVRNNKTFIDILVDTAIFETFEVVGLGKTTQKNLGDKSYVLTLVRQR